MTDFVISNWGSLASVVGLVISAVGLIWAIIIARGARLASRAAQSASQETSAQIARHLQSMNLERAIALIQRLKLLHRFERWEAALEQYQALRMMLSEILAIIPESATEPRQALHDAIQTVRIVESSVEVQSVDRLEPEAKVRLNRRLNSIQSRLESLVSAQGFGDAPRRYHD